MTDPRTSRRLAWWLFATVLSVNLLCFSGTVRSIDGGTMLAVTRSLVRRGDFAVPEEAVGSRGRDGRKYAQYGPACSFLAVPFFLVGHGLGQIPRLPPERAEQVEELAVALFNPLVVALTAALVFLAALDLGLARRTALAGGLLCAFGTGLFVQMKDFNSEPLSALLFLAATVALVRRRGWGDYARAGVAAGLALLTRPANALGVGILGVAVVYAAMRDPLPASLAGLATRPSPARRERVRSGGQVGRRVGYLLAFTVPVLAGAALYGWYNWARFGDPLNPGYHLVTFNNPLLAGLHLQLFSLERGLIWYDPLVLLAPAGAIALWRRRPGLVLLVGVLFLGFLLLYATYAQAPAGGHSAGQRFLLVVVPLLVLVGLPVVETAWRSPKGRAAQPLRHSLLSLACGGEHPEQSEGAEGVRPYPSAGGTPAPPPRPWQRALVAVIIAASVLVQLPLVYLNPSYYYARLGAEREAAGRVQALGSAADALLIRAWVLAAEVTRDTLTRPEWVRALAERAGPVSEAAALLPGPRSFHVPYFWWALAWAYGVPSSLIVPAVLAALTLAALSVRSLRREARRAAEQ